MFTWIMNVLEAIRQRLMSRTYWLAAVLVAAGVAQPYVDLISPVMALLPGGTGTVFAVVGVLIAWLREVTNKPLSAK